MKTSKPTLAHSPAHEAASSAPPLSHDQITKSALPPANAIPKEHPMKIAAPPKQNAKARILVVDDHPMLRQGIVEFINRQSDVAVCGEADSIASTQSAVLRD